MKKIEKVVELIVNLMNEAIKEEEERCNYKFERTNMKAFLQEIYGDMTSAEFKEQVRYIVTEYDNDNYRNGIESEDILMRDDGSIEDTDGTLYTYRQIMARVRSKVFTNDGEEE